jgi:hypothetical protein
MPLPHDPFAPDYPEVVESSATQPVDEPAKVEVPKGTSSEVLAWVAGDRERAQSALDAENATDKPRKGLVEELKELVAE